MYPLLNKLYNTPFIRQGFKKHHKMDATWTWMILEYDHEDWDFLTKSHDNLKFPYRKLKVSYFWCSKTHEFRLKTYWISCILQWKEWWSWRFCTFFFSRNFCRCVHLLRRLSLFQGRINSCQESILTSGPLRDWRYVQVCVFDTLKCISDTVAIEETTKP